MYVCGECGQSSERIGTCDRDGTPLTQTDDPLLGTEVGRYRLAKLIGEGGMGRVYLAVQPAIGSRVAVKILSDQCARDPALLERFFAEARAVNLVRHEHIVSVIDLARLDDGRPYIVMEYIAGETLGALVRGGKAPLGGVVTVAIEVLSALGAAHAIGIVHRDLKPDNVLLTAEGHAKVLDFGIAKLAPGLSNDSPRTATGALLGTPAYMAPEQITGAEHVDTRTDIYAAGVLLFEAVTGRAPFAGATLFDLMRAHLELPPPSPRGLRPDLPVALEAVILTALAKDPAQRYQTAAAMAEALQLAARELPPHAWQSLSTRSSRTHRPVATAAAPPERPSLMKRNMYVAGIVAAVIFAGIAIGAASRGGSSKPPAGQPQILGGGSATDHGVRIGDNVKIGDNVVIGGDPPNQVMATLPLDYDPKHFDASAYLATAEKLAREALPDAELVRFDITGVYPDGHADLTLPSIGESSYAFRSPAKSVRPANVPSNLDVEIDCYVEVTVLSTGAEVKVRDMRPIDGDCKAPLRPRPRCTLADVWKRARGADPNAVAKIGYLHDGWFFDTEHAGKGLVTSIADACP